jgi:hypothetical protein
MANLGPSGDGGDSELDPRREWVRREQKAAAETARFGVHFTQIIIFSAMNVQARRPLLSMMFWFLYRS